MNAQNQQNEIESKRVVTELSARALDGDQRIEKIRFEGADYWIKRLHIDDSKASKRIYNFLVKLFRKPFLRQTPLVSAEETTQREVRKYAQFAKAGITVPKVIWSNETMLLIEDASPNVLRYLEEATTRDDQKQADAYLIEFGEVLTSVHKAGLCHGRPHTRDAVIINGKMGFIDFEEEPEANMPMHMAQARDFWLAMTHICERASNDKTLQKIYDHWAKQVPLETLSALGEFNAFFLKLLKIAEKIPENKRGSDLKRGMLATAFIDKAIADTKKST